MPSPLPRRRPPPLPRRAPRTARSRASAPGRARRAARRRPARRGSAPRSGPGSTDTPSGRPGQARLERLAGHRDPDPGEPRLAERGHQARAPLLLAAERGPLPVRPQLPQERGPPKDTRRPDALRPERPHQLRRPRPRHPEQPLHVAPREQVPVQGLELADGVGDGEEPPGLGGIGERRVGYNPCGECEVGRCLARMLCSMLVDDRPRCKLRAGRGEGPIKGVMGRRDRRRTQRRHRGPRRAHRAAGPVVAEAIPAVLGVGVASRSQPFGRFTEENPLGCRQSPHPSPQFQFRSAVFSVLLRALERSMRQRRSKPLVLL